MQLMLREVVMLRNRSRAVTSKQAIMADHNTQINQNHTTPSSSFLCSPRFFNGFSSRTLSDAAAENMSPTSILENTKKSNFVNPFGYNRNPPQPQIISSEKEQIHEKLDSESIGLAIIDSFKDERKMVLFGAKLKVQIPSVSESPKSPADFGIKTRNSQTLSPFSVFGSENSPQGLNMKLSLSEMEMSEDYTCVITHGPNPKTIHIFDNCIVDSCCGVVGISDLKNEHQISTNNSMNFMSFCYTCKDNLQEGKDIFMYRGEKAFCSNECRCQEMFSEEEKNSEMEY